MPAGVRHIAGTGGPAATIPQVCSGSAPAPSGRSPRSIERLWAGTLPLAGGHLAHHAAQSAMVRGPVYPQGCGGIAGGTSLWVVMEVQ